MKMLGMTLATALVLTLSAGESQAQLTIGNPYNGQGITITRNGIAPTGAVYGNGYTNGNPYGYDTNGYANGAYRMPGTNYYSSGYQAPGAYQAPGVVAPNGYYYQNNRAYRRGYTRGYGYPMNYGRTYTYPVLPGTIYRVR
jgi:hypothetical protein